MTELQWATSRPVGRAAQPGQHVILKLEHVREVSRRNLQDRAFRPESRTERQSLRVGPSLGAGPLSFLSLPSSSSLVVLKGTSGRQAGPAVGMRETAVSREGTQMGLGGREGKGGHGQGTASLELARDRSSDGRS